MEKFIVRADNVDDLISESARVTWQRHGVSVLEVLEEQFGLQHLYGMAPEELIEIGFRQGVGQVLIDLATAELIPFLRERRRKGRPPQRQEN